jgi:hypothetical protein
VRERESARENSMSMINDNGMMRAMIASVVRIYTLCRPTRLLDDAPSTRRSGRQFWHPLLAGVAVTLLRECASCS